VPTEPAKIAHARLPQLSAFCRSCRSFRSHSALGRRVGELEGYRAPLPCICLSHRAMRTAGLLATKPTLESAFATESKRRARRQRRSQLRFANLTVNRVVHRCTGAPMHHVHHLKQLSVSDVSDADVVEVPAPSALSRSFRRGLSSMPRRMSLSGPRIPM
jgi:hypothetical protein